MIHLRNRTEYSFGSAIGRVAEVLDCQEPGAPAAITDRHGTWGHVRWDKACRKRGIEPIFGVELAVVEDIDRSKKERSPTNYMTLLARDKDGLREIYEWVTVATENFYYVPRLDYSMVTSMSPRIIILSGMFPEWKLLPKKMKEHLYVELNQMSSPAIVLEGIAKGFSPIATQDNLFPRAGDLALYQAIMGIKAAQMRTAPSYILSGWQWQQELLGKGLEEKLLRIAQNNVQLLSKRCRATIPTATMVKPKAKFSLSDLCAKGVKKRKLKMSKEYVERLKKELDLIHDKGFEDYFYVVAEMVTWAKERMLVGPARGSSCGSLVCYLLGITDIDPMEYGLLFERFIDVNREDFPDIDIDFADDRRDLVFGHLRELYGHDNVARLGTINVFKARSAITVAAKELKVPIWEVEEFKNSIIERSSGDARSEYCVMDTFEQLALGKILLKKYPELSLSARLEGHASHTGMHAAGIVITANKVTNYCPVHNQNGNVMLDKFDAEHLRMLKIDCLGLRTLSTIQDTLDQVGWKPSQLLNHTKDDPRAFEILNKHRFSGIFQFEGFAVQNCTKQFKVETFDDIANLTALARPGPLMSGGTEDFVKRRSGREPVSFMHPLIEPMTRVTYGVIIYQEQVMEIARKVGALSWEDVSQLRRAMSKSYGKEYFDNYWKKFWEGARTKHKMKEQDARAIWDQINTMGSWAFNRSHAVAYGTISYWCCLLKAYFPLEYGASCLRNERDNDKVVKLLRELVKEGYEYKPFDPLHSMTNWTVADGKLIGGLTGIVGIGPKLAENIIRKRSTHNGKGDPIPFSKREIELLNRGTTPYDHVFEAQERFAGVFKNPKKHGVESELRFLNTITSHDTGQVVFIAKLVKKILRDHNEPILVAKRGGHLMKGEMTTFLNAMVEDDTENIMVTISRHLFDAYGKPLMDVAKLGDWFVWKGEMMRGIRRVKILRWKCLTNKNLKPVGAK